MDNAITPWPALVKRLRFLSGLKQEDLAEQLGVDQCTVSRWERNLCIPDTSVQKRVRDMLYKLEPAINRSFIENSPAFVAITHIGNAGLAECVSPLVAASYYSDPAALRGKECYGITTESERNFLSELNGNAAWCNGEIASWEGVMLQVDGTWAMYSAAAIGQSGLCMWIGGLVTPSEEVIADGFQLTFHSFDELCD